MSLDSFKNHELKFVISQNVRYTIRKGSAGSNNHTVKSNSESSSFYLKGIEFHFKKLNKVTYQFHRSHVVECLGIE